MFFISLFFFFLLVGILIQVWQLMIKMRFFFASSVACQVWNVGPMVEFEKSMIILPKALRMVRRNSEISTKI
jgi:hypothetical protein